MDKQIEDEAFITCHNFMKAWKNKNWKKILKYCQITWVKDGHPNQSAVDWLKHSLSHIAPLEWSLKERNVVGEATVDITLTVSMMVDMGGYKTKQKVTKTRTARVICELDSYQPSIDGTWGVNPVSCLRVE